MRVGKVRRAPSGDSVARRVGVSPFTATRLRPIARLIHPENRSTENRSTGTQLPDRAALELAFRSWFTREIGTAKAYARLTGVSLAVAEKRRLGALPDLAREGPALCAAHGDSWLVAMMAPALDRYLETCRAAAARAADDSARWSAVLAASGRRSAAHRPDPRAR